MFAMQYRVATKRTGECPICLQAGKGCKTDLISQDRLILCRKVELGHRSNGFISLGETQNGIWRMFKEGDDSSTAWTEEQEATRIARREKEQKDREYALELERKRIVASIARNTQTLEYIKNNPLKPEHRAILNAKGLSDELLEYAEAFSTWKGFGIPIVNLQGDRMLGQHKAEGEHRWIFRGQNKRHETGQQPLSIYGNRENPERIVLVDSVSSKVAKTAFEHPNWLVVGASGGTFTASSKEVAEVLRAYPRTPFTWLPDGGCLSNNNVMRQIETTHAMFSTLRRNLDCGWWGQFEKGGTDIDEIDPNTEIEYITFDELKAKRDWPSDIGFLIGGFLKRRLAKVTQQQPIDIESNILIELDIDGFYTVTEESEYYGDELITTKNVSKLEGLISEGILLGKKVILDISQAGKGKSTASALLRDIEEINQIIHLSNRSRNLTTQEARDGYILVPSRAKAFYKLNGRQSVPGTDDIVTTKPSEGVSYEQLEGNCHLAGEINALMNSGWESDLKLCSKCPFFSECKTSQGDGFGYIYQVNEAMKNKRLVGSLALQYRLQNEDLGKTLIVIDDERPITSRTMSITVEQIEKEVCKIARRGDMEVVSQVVPLLSRVIELIQKPSTYGFNHSEIFKGFELNDADDLIDKVGQICAPDLNRLSFKGIGKTGIQGKLEKHNFKTIDEIYPDEIAPNFVSWMLQIASSESVGACRTVGKTLEVTIGDSVWQSVQDKAKAVLILDATANKEYLAKELGCESDDIFTISQPRTECKNERVVHIQGAADFSKARTKDLTHLVEAALEKIHGAGNVHTLDRKGFGELGGKLRGTMYADNRGTNMFKGYRALLQTGLHVPCRGALAIQFALLTGRHVDPSGKDGDQEFSAYVNYRTEAEEIQAQARQRACRDPENTYTRYVISNKADICSDALKAACPGIVIERVQMSDICLEAAKKGERTLLKILRVIGGNPKGKLRDIATVLNLAESTISHYLSQFGGFRKTCEILYILLTRKTEVTNQDLELFLQNNSLLVESVTEVLGDTINDPLESATGLGALLEPLDTSQLSRLMACLNPNQLDTATELTILLTLKDMKLSETGDTLDELTEGLRYLITWNDGVNLEVLIDKHFDDKESMQAAANKLTASERTLLKDMVVMINRSKAMREAMAI